MGPGFLIDEGFRGDEVSHRSLGRGKRVSRLTMLSR